MDSYRPHHRADAPSRQAQSTEVFPFGENRRHGFRFKAKAFERDLLTQAPTTVENPILSSTQTDPKFRDVKDITDSEEADMEEDSDFEDSQPVKKRKLASEPQTPIEQPAWSNPDPYTSLPPLPEVSGKKRDVVKLIRKARNESEKHDTFAADQNDFISFGDFGDDDFLPPVNAPSGPRADRHGQSNSNGVIISRNDASQALGKRKRAGSDNDSLMGRPGRQQFHANGTVLIEWRETSDQSRSPWLRPFAPNDSAMVALHKEILDFYAWVKPQEYETIMRQDVVNRLEQELCRFRPGVLEAFGSYAAGLHLPTGDMDLVYFKRGRPRNANLHLLDFDEFVRYLRRSKIVEAGSVKPIRGAKVPIIKFVDALTGLRVDLSFHNTTGVDAIETFKKWKGAYPAMPIIVSVIKQLLMIRGLNDNSVGGLGGFSTICMVTSLLQHMPCQPNPNLGEVLIEFFNLYGNLLDFKNVGIRLEPPAYIKKSEYLLLRNGNEKLNRLMIIDPNKADNNISGGSSEVSRILTIYSKIHQSLHQKLEKFSTQENAGPVFSFLDELVGGSFTAYDQQRASLRTAYQQMTGHTFRQPTPPPPPPAFSIAIPPPPPATPKVSGSSSSTPRQDGDSTLNASVRRLKRLRDLRPDLESILRDRTSISKNQAYQLAGYTSAEAMGVDLAEREAIFHQKRKEAVKKKKT